MSNILKQSYRDFLLNSKNEHGVHSPFVYDLVTKCLRNKRYTPSLYKELKNGFPRSFNAKHIRILNDVISHLEIVNYGHFCKSEHSIDKLPITRLLTKTKHSTADLIYLPVENFNSHHVEQVINELKKGAVLIIEDPYSNNEVWNLFKEKQKKHIVIDTYFFGFIFNRSQQANEHFNIRI